MQLLKKLQLFDRLHHLIRTSSTGTPKELARRISLSERQLYRLIEELKDMGLPVVYCREKHCYHYEEEVKVNMELHIGNVPLLRILR